METVLAFISIISAIFILAEGQTCTSDSYPVLKMCYQEQASGSTIMMDFEPAEDQNSDTCNCQIQIISGTTLAFSQVYAYENKYCGTTFVIENTVFECRGSTSISVNAGETLSLDFNKVQYNKESRYCYSIGITDCQTILQIVGGSAPSMTITCTGVQFNTTTTSTTTTTTTPTTTTTTTTKPPTTTTTTKPPTTTTTSSTTSTTTTEKPTTTTRSPPTTTTQSPPTTESITTTTTTTKPPTTTTKPDTTTTKPSTTTTKTTVSSTSSTTQTQTTGNASQSSGTTPSSEQPEKGASAADEVPWMIVIPVIGVGAFLILALIVVIVLLCQRKNKENGKSDKYEQPYIAHENQGMVLNDERPYNKVSDPKTNTSTFTTDEAEQNNKNSASNGDAVTDSNNINDLYATPQKKTNPDAEPEVTISTEVI